MSMYAELLVASLGQSITPGERASEVGALLAQLLAARLRLGERQAGAGPEGDLAANIEYDLALLRLCAARGVDADPRRFDRPGQERARLEGELALRGTVLDELKFGEEPVTSPETRAVDRGSAARPAG
jgi:hypothetical protein